MINKVERAVFLMLFVLGICSCSTDKRKPEASGTLKLLSAEETGIDFINEIPFETQLNFEEYSYLFNGGGVAIADFDNDGLEDVFFTSNMSNNQLYRNLGGLKFENVSESGGFNIDDGSWSTGVNIVDINQDGLKDIYVCKAGLRDSEKRKNQLFINQGNLMFEESAAQYGLADTGWSNQSCFLDYDNDGDLDCYVVNHPIAPNLFVIEQDKDIRGGSSDKLYRNDGGKFSDVSELAGLHADANGFGLTACAFDINRDGHQDIYVTNDFTINDYVYINQGNGTFKDEQLDLLEKMSYFSMGMDVADISNDGLPEIFVADMTAEDNYRNKLMMGGMYPENFYAVLNQGFNYQYMFNALQLNMGNASFSEIGQMCNVATTDWSWSPLFVDLDNDGFKDLTVTNGYLRDIRNSDINLKAKKAEYEGAKMSPEEYLNQTPSVKIPNYLFRNTGDINFQKIASDWGADQPSFSNGSAYADLDNDGDMELIISNINEPVFVYNNDIADANYIQFQLKGPGNNPDAIGAEIEIITANKEQTHHLQSNRGFLSSSSLVAHFGLGSEDKVQKAIITWSDGSSQLIEQPDANKKHLVAYAPNEKKQTEQINYAFEKMQMNQAIYYHIENPKDDYATQVLLPHKLSNMGPKLQIFENQNSKQLYIGGAKGQNAAMAMFNNNNTGKLQISGALLNTSFAEEVNARALDLDGDKQKDLIICNGGYEYNETAPGLVALKNENGNFVNYMQLPEINEPISEVVLFQKNKNAQELLIAFSNLLPTKYPKAPSAHALVKQGNNWVIDNSELSASLESFGMVYQAKVVDLDGDGNNEILAIGEWMSPVVIEQDESGNLIRSKRFKGLDNQSGWWRSLESVDIDNDGDLDFIAGNLGTNYKYKATEEYPFYVYHGDLDNSGSHDIILSYENFGEYFPVRGFKCSSEQMPVLIHEVETFHNFAISTTENLYGDKLENAEVLQANNFASSVFINDGNGNFSVQPLPRLAQLSMVNSIIVQDLNNDNFHDLIIAGNLFEAEVETPKADAGKGLVLINDKNGGFKPMMPYDTGLYLEGNLRDLELITINNKQYLFAVYNNGPLEIWKLNTTNLPMHAES